MLFCIGFRNPGGSLNWYERCTCYLCRLGLRMSQRFGLPAIQRTPRGFPNSLEANI